MPIYTYKCIRCGYQFDLLRPMEDREILPFCAKCLKQDAVEVESKQVFTVGNLGIKINQ